MHGLYWFFIEPLELLFEFVFSLSYKAIDHPGICIIILSIVMNLLALPLYRRADALQKEEKEKMGELEPGIDHIKKTFKGDERLLILQTFYRQNDYSPLHVFRGSISLFLQIPFFMAAYRMLSSLSILSGKSFGPINDLGAPDGLIVIGGIAINLLPVLMTAINIVSSSIYLKGSDIKTKIQLYGIAAIFLVLLYNSPAGLVFYWTCNNLFSLMKNIFIRGEKRKKKEVTTEKKDHPLVFILCAVYNAVLTGLYIPSTVIASSPADFVDGILFRSPNVYVYYSLLLAAGTFILWFGVFYYLSGKKGRCVMEMISSASVIVFTVDYLALGKRYGQFTNRLQYADPDMHLTNFALEAIVLVFLSFAVVYLLTRHNRKIIVYAVVGGLLFFLGSGVKNVISVSSEIGEMDYVTRDLGRPEITLSSSGKNVVVIMLDRAEGCMLPYIFNERPDLKEQFDGFTYYPNTVSFGGHTNFAAPALFGGYEYTPDAINSRADEPLAGKHDEALKVLPVLFYENGYDVTLCDLPYAGYHNIPDLSIFDDYPDMKTYITQGYFNDMKEAEVSEKNTILERNFFCYSILRISPMCLQGIFYDSAYYNYPDRRNDWTFIPVYKRDGSGVLGYPADFLDSFTALDALPGITTVTDDATGTLTELDNNTTHSTAILSEPDYVLEYRVDNSEYDRSHLDRFTLDGVTLSMENYMQYAAYEVNMAAYIELGEWFDYLREQGVYDNTRIIIVSDHGYDLDLLPSGIENGSTWEWFNPLFLVKDFDAEGFTVSEEFMTNADTPVLALEGIVNDPVNPFTGNRISSDPKYDGDLLIFESHEFIITRNNGNTFLPGNWYSVSDDIRRVENWTYEGEW